MGWGAPGPGRWITVYANPGHVYMEVGGLRFDTSGRAGRRGSRWQGATALSARLRGAPLAGSVAVADLSAAAVHDVDGRPRRAAIDAPAAVFA